MDEKEEEEEEEVESIRSNSRRVSYQRVPFPCRVHEDDEAAASKRATLPKADIVIDSCVIHEEEQKWVVTPGAVANRVEGEASSEYNLVPRTRHSVTVPVLLVRLDLDERYLLTKEEEEEEEEEEDQDEEEGEEEKWIPRAFLAPNPPGCVSAANNVPYPYLYHHCAWLLGLVANRSAPFIIRESRVHRLVGEAHDCLEDLLALRLTLSRGSSRGSNRQVAGRGDEDNLAAFRTEPPPPPFAYPSAYFRFSLRVREDSREYAMCIPIQRCTYRHLVAVAVAVATFAVVAVRDDAYALTMPYSSNGTSSLSSLWE
ncbi:hypothetical protein HZH68_010115 [Vespula germanica]|uniref:Uncharacterized protein n=1 Tax=Vespula germanica TaxID=30212 RepID=A0A834N537_VESGE|nr:hypothetical protein HZH68_010115 [Vespula germanica]